jgi:signal transduction histidine kinase
VIPRAVFVLVAVVGAAVTIVAAGLLRMSAKEAVTLTAISVAGSFVAGVISMIVLGRVKAKSLTVQMAILSLTCIGAVAAAAILMAWAMFISRHDLAVLIVVLSAAATVDVLIALLVADRLGRAGRELLAAVRRVGRTTRVDPKLDGPRELVELAQELEATSARLEAATNRERALETARRDLVAWVSHDLRTPLAGIRAMTEALEDGIVDDPETVARYHQSLMQETDRLAGMVDDLFELSRIHAGSLNLNIERVSLADLISDSLSAADAVARAKGVNLEGKLASAPPHLDLSVAEMSRVLRNLLENAIRHTPSDGTVWVEMGVADDRAVVSISDECGGIPEVEMARVFDMGYRGEPARTPNEGPRAGLGLAIARGIVEAHRGEVSVENAGAGCRFILHLPIPGAA